MLQFLEYLARDVGLFPTQRHSLLMIGPEGSRDLSLALRDPSRVVNLAPQMKKSPLER